MRSRTHNVRCISTSVIPAPPLSPNAMEVRSALAACRFHAGNLRRTRESGHGDIQGRRAMLLAGMKSAIREHELVAPLETGF